MCICVLVTNGKEISIFKILLNFLNSVLISLAFKMG